MLSPDPCWCEHPADKFAASSEPVIELDPDCGQASALLSLSIFLDWFGAMREFDAGLDLAFELARRAVALGENGSICQSALGWGHCFGRPSSWPWTAALPAGVSFWSKATKPA